MILDRFGRVIATLKLPEEAPAAPAPEPPAEAKPVGEDHPTVRALMHALGYDPDTHQGVIRRQPHAGLLVLDAEGKRVRFFTAKQLMDLRHDENVVADFGLATGKG